MGVRDLLFVIVGGITLSFITNVTIILPLKLKLKVMPPTITKKRSRPHHPLRPKHVVIPNVVVYHSLTV